jgi:Domain of unknown function (DUF4436)
VTRRWKPSHRQTIALVVAGVLIIAGVGAYASYRGYTTSVSHTGDRDVGSIVVQRDAPSKDEVAVLASIDGVSPDARTVDVRLHFLFPKGSKGGSLVTGNLGKPVTVTVLGGVADPNQGVTPTMNEFALDVNQPLPTFDVKADIFDDSGPKYPFDSYSTYLALKVVGSDRKPVAFEMGAENEVNGWIVAKQRQTPSDGLPKGAYGISFDIHRTTDAKFYAIFIIALMWLLALAGVVMAVILIGRKDQEVGPDHLVYLAALLFAFPLMRTLLPGNPPLGILADFAGYFWAEVIVGITLLALLVTWIVRTRRSHEEIDLREAPVEREESAPDPVDVH